MKKYKKLFTLLTISISMSLSSCAEVGNILGQVLKETITGEVSSGETTGSKTSKDTSTSESSPIQTSSSTACATQNNSSYIYDLKDDLSVKLFKGVQAQKSNYNGKIPYHDVNTPRTVIAPKPAGGFYLAWVDAKKEEVKIAELDNDGSIITKAFTPKSQRGPFDRLGGLTAVDNKGFALLASRKESFSKSLPHKPDKTEGEVAEVLYYSQDRTLNFAKQLTKAHENEEPFAWGSSRIAYGNGHIAAYFGKVQPWSTVTDGFQHQSDTMRVFDLQGAQIEQLTSGLSSHSLDLRMFFNQNQFVKAALGDFAPRGIAVGYSKLDTKVSEQFTPIDELAANGGGSTSGRLGNLVPLDCQTFALTYTTFGAKVWNQWGDGDSYRKGKWFESHDDELGLLLTDGSKTLNKYSLREGHDIQYLKTAKYGKNLVMAWRTRTVDNNEWNTSEKKEEIKGQNGTSYGRDFPVQVDVPITTSDDAYYIMLVSPEGKILSKAKQLPESYSFNSGDDFVTLPNGDVVWMDTNQEQLRLYRLSFKASN